MTPMHALPTLARPSLQQLSSLLVASQPAVLTGLISRWPAFHSWTRQNSYGSLRTSGQGRTIDVEWSRKGRGYMDDGEKGRSQMDLGAYVNAFLLSRLPYRDGRPAEEMVVYVAQQDLLNSIPGLKSDVPDPPFQVDYFKAGKGEFWRSNLWIGPEGTFTPIHKDPYHNLFCQLESSKTFFLYPPSTPPASLYLARPPQHQTSLLPVAPHLIDLKQHPAFAQAKAEEVKVVLGRGETLFLPQGWWHAVLAEDVDRERVQSEGDFEGRVSINWWFL